MFDMLGFPDKYVPKILFITEYGNDQKIYRILKKEYFSQNDLLVFYNKLIERLYPGLIKALNIITEKDNFDLVKSEILFELFNESEELKDTKINLYTPLNEVIVPLCNSGILKNDIVQRVKELFEKLVVPIERYTKFKIVPEPLSTTQKKMLFDITNLLHYSISSLGDRYSKVACSHQLPPIKERERILTKFSDIERFPTKEKIEKIYKENDWQQLSIASKKSSKKEVKPFVDLVTSDFSYKK